MRFLSAHKTFFRCFYMKEHHWLCTTEIIPPFAQNGTSYRAVVLYKFKRRHCYCTPYFISLTPVYINIPSQYDIVSMAKRFHIGFYAKCNKNMMKCICAAYLDSRKKHFEPPHGRQKTTTNKMTFVPSEDSDQPEHPPSLIRVFAVRSMGSLGSNFALGGQRRLGCPGWYVSSLGAQIIFLVLSCRGSIFILKPLQKPLRMAL